MTRIMELSNGEVLNEKEEDMRFDRFPIEHGYMLIGSNIKLIHLGRPSIPVIVKASDKGYLLDLCCHLSKHGIVMGKHLPMRGPEMATYLGLNKSSLYRMIDRLETAGVVRMVKGKMYVNPIYFTQSRYVHPDLYEVFADELDIHLPEWVIGRYQRILRERA